MDVVASGEPSPARKGPGGSPADDSIARAALERYCDEWKEANRSQQTARSDTDARGQEGRCSLPGRLDADWVRGACTAVFGQPSAGDASLWTRPRKSKAAAGYQAFQFSQGNLAPWWRWDDLVQYIEAHQPDWRTWGSGCWAKESKLSPRSAWAQKLHKLTGKWNQPAEREAPVTDPKAASLSWSLRQERPLR